MAYGDPNVTLPLSFSYNERGVAGRTTTLTNGKDQRKTNSFYEIAQNSISGRVTAYLTKRPGIQDSGQMLSTTGIPYLISRNPAVPFANESWVFSVSGSSMLASNVSTSTTIFTDGGATWYPSFVDIPIISGVGNTVIQYRKDADTAQRVFYATAIGSWTEITDADFTALIHRGKMESIDGWQFIGARDNYIYNSDLNSLSAWNPNNRIQKAVQSDFFAGCAKLGQRLLAFGNETVEVFGNAGNPSGSPLQRISSARVGLGDIAANLVGSPNGRRHYSCVINRVLYFQGSVADKDKTNGLWAFTGEAFEKVSQTFIDKILAANNNFHIQRIMFFGKEAVAIALNNVTATTQNWLMYFPDTKDWFEWNSTYVQPVTDGTFFIGIGGVNPTKLGQFLATNVWVDGVSSTYSMVTQFQIPKNGFHRKVMPWCAVDADTAASASNLSVEFSDDDYATWSAARDIDLSSAEKFLTRCGSYKNRAVRLTHSANLECRLGSFTALTQ